MKQKGVSGPRMGPMARSWVGHIVYLVSYTGDSSSPPSHLLIFTKKIDAQENPAQFDVRKVSET
jgi:hypothetical protein